MGTKFPPRQSVKGFASYRAKNMRETEIITLESSARHEIVEICRRMYNRRYISGTDGNVSVRLSRNRILVTPSGVNKGFLRESDMVLLDSKGNLIKGKTKPSSEVKMHLLAYEMREDIGAAVHAHPVNAIAFTIARVSLAQCVLPEAVLSFGEVPTAGYATPSTGDVPRVLCEHLLKHDAVMMDRHGSLTLGRTLEEAYNRLESLEHTAEITLRARLLGPVAPLPQDEVLRLKNIAKDMGAQTSFTSCEGCNVCRPSGKKPS